MKLLLIFAAILAFSFAEEEKKAEVQDDSQAEASATIELMKEGVDLNAAASTYTSYVPPSQRPPHWQKPNYVPPQNTWVPPKPMQPVQTGVPEGVQSDYYDPHHHHHHHWSTPAPAPIPVYHPPATAAPVTVIKNERYYGENGYYRYEYKMTDGTWVGEEGYYTDPKQTEESLVKKGWYSYVGADKKTYTVSYWADHTGYHAYGDHLPTPPPSARAQEQEQGDKFGPQHDYPSQTPAPVHYPTQTPAPVYYPTKAPYVHPQPTYQPPQQPSYPPQQPSYPPQPQYYPVQNNY